MSYFSLQKRKKQEKHIITSALIKSLEYTTHPFPHHNHQQKRLSWGMQDLWAAEAGRSWNQMQHRFLINLEVLKWLQGSPRLCLFLQYLWSQPQKYK